MFFSETITLSPLFPPGLCVTFLLSHIKIYSQGEKKISCHLYTLKTKISVSQIIYDKGPIEDQYFRKTQ